MNRRASYEQPGRDRGSYIEACARIRSMEKRLLDAEALEDLISLREDTDIFHALERFGRLPHGHADAGAGWDRALTMGAKQSDTVLLGLDPDPALTGILLMEFDLINLATLVASEKRHGGHSGSLHPRGRRTEQDLRLAAETIDFGLFPHPLAKTLRACLAAAPDRNFRHVMEAVTVAHHEALRRVALEQRNTFFLDYLGHRADLRNVLRHLRRLLFPGAWTKGAVLLEGGGLEPAHFADGYDFDDFLSMLSGTAYGRLLEKSLGPDGTVQVEMLEKEADDFLIDLLRPAKYATMGPEPVWAYYLARQVDDRNLRWIVLAHLSGGPADRVRGRLRRPYV